MQALILPHMAVVLVGTAWIYDFQSGLLLHKLFCPGSLAPRAGGGAPHLWHMRRKFAVGGFWNRHGIWQLHHPQLEQYGICQSWHDRADEACASHRLPINMVLRSNRRLIMQSGPRNEPGQSEHSHDTVWKAISSWLENRSCSLRRRDLHRVQEPSLSVFWTTFLPTLRQDRHGRYNA